MDTIGQNQNERKPRYARIHKQLVRDVPYGPLMLHLVKTAWKHTPKEGWATILGVTRQAVYAWSQYKMPVIPNDGRYRKSHYDLSILLDPEVRQAGKAAYLALETFTGNGSCFPFIKTLAAAVNKSERYIQKGLAELVDKGYLTIERRPNTSNVYRLHYRPTTMRGHPYDNERTPLMTMRGHPQRQQTDTPRFWKSPVLLWRQGRFQEAILNPNPNPKRKKKWLENSSPTTARSEAGCRGEGRGASRADALPHPVSPFSPLPVSKEKTPVTDLDRELFGYVYDDEPPPLSSSRWRPTEDGLMFVGGDDLSRTRLFGCGRGGLQSSKPETEKNQ